MARSRKKPVVIEAMLVSELNDLARHDFRKLPKWILDAYEKGAVLFLNHPNRIDINTLEGTMTGNANDWIICGVQGELYPCEPDIFEATYEAVLDEELVPA